MFVTKPLPTSGFKIYHVTHDLPFTIDSPVRINVGSLDVLCVLSLPAAMLFWQDEHFLSACQVEEYP